MKGISNNNFWIFNDTKLTNKKLTIIILYINKITLKDVYAMFEKMVGGNQSSLNNL